LALGKAAGGTADGKKISVNEAIARGLIQSALNPKDKYHIESVRIFLDRTEGRALERVAQQIDLTGGVVVPKALVVPKPIDSEIPESGERHLEDVRAKRRTQEEGEDR
jgi:hypothetical protein